MNPLGRRRINSRQHPMQPCNPMLLHTPPQPRPQILLPRRPREQPLRQRPQIEPSPSSHNRQFASPRNLPQRSTRLPTIFTGREHLVRINHIDQMMHHSRPFFGRRFRRPQIHPAIHRHRIAADNLAAKALRQRQRQRRLPAPRRPQQQNNERIGLVRSHHR